MSKKAKYILSAVLFALFILLAVLLKTVDVAPIGPEGTSIGLSHLNVMFRDMIGTNQDVYMLTKIAGIVTIGIVGIFAVMGLVQWIQRKNLFKIDRELLYLAGLYFAIFVFYVLFNKVIVINYRPVIMPGDLHPEPSFPSSHSLMGCVVMGSAFMLVKRYVERDALDLILRAFCVINMLVLVLGRFLSGVHWFTDILGGILLGFALLLIYSAQLDGIDEKE
ncbi:MAG: phosphatase PAP2 family protein [Solobacterium sp.]|nr:phosphatase PAP2 family protein [Solobacterium sp.]